MDNLLEIATKAMENFDPKTDPVDDFEPLPDGDYTCLFEEATYRKNDKGTEWVSLKFTIIDGDYENRCIFVNQFFTDKTALRSVKTITKMAVEFGYDMPLENFSNQETLIEALNQMAGNNAIVHQKTSSNGFVNYKITGALD